MVRDDRVGVLYASIVFIRGVQEAGALFCLFLCVDGARVWFRTESDLFVECYEHGFLAYALPTNSITLLLDYHINF